MVAKFVFQGPNIEYCSMCIGAPVCFDGGCEFHLTQINNAICCVVPTKKELEQKQTPKPYDRHIT